MNDRRLVQFGLNVKQLRNECGMTLRELQKKSGVTHSYIDAIENGRAVNPSLRHAIGLADALGVSLGDMLKRMKPLPTSEFPNGFLHGLDGDDNTTKLAREMTASGSDAGAARAGGQ